MSLLANSNAIETGGYQISRSVRLRSSASAYLSRTLTTPTDGKKWTYSFWIKRGSLTTNQPVLTAYTDANNQATLYHTTGNKLYWLSTTGGSTYTQFRTDALYRDPSAWYHFVVVFDSTNATSTDRIKMYVNGTSLTCEAGQYIAPALNTTAFVNTAIGHRIGNDQNLGIYLDGYLTEINFIDGQALTPSSFGETDSITGVWKAKKYGGTYGTNGFYLNFSDNSSNTATTIGKDYSGNGNNWTPNNISVTAGSTYDSMLDVPSGNGYADGGNGRGNYCVLNPLDISGTTGTYASGNLNFTKSTAGNAQAYSSFQVTSGKWYCEVTMGADIAEFVPGIIAGSANAGANRYLGQDSFTYAYYNNGQKINAASYTAYGNSYTTGNVIGIILDADNGKLYFSKDGVVQNSGDPVGGTGFAFSGLTGPYRFAASAEAGGTSDFNFGQRPFSYAVPSGYSALNTTNLPTPTIGATSTTQAGKYMNAVLYTGTGSSNAQTGVGFQPDLVWIKSRSGATDHGWYDAVRGVQKQLESNTTTAETTETTGLTAFGSDGFTVGALAQLNTSSATYVAWNWKANGTGSTNTAGTITSTVSANTTAGFSIATTTGTGGAGTIGHGLGAIPQFIMSFRRNTAADHYCYHQAIGNTNFLVLNTTAASAASANLWNNTTPTSTVFSVGNTNNNSGDTYVHYIFAPIPGYSAFGSYTGNANADGPFVYCGFRPAYILIKSSTDGTTNWLISDNKRLGYNITSNQLKANTSAAEESFASGWHIDFVSNGFKVRNNFANMNGSGTYIYAAFSESPFKFSNAR